jgi:hypothetical protein
MADRNVGAMTNYAMHRWSTGQISDSQLMEELSTFVFADSKRGQALRGYLMVA